MLTANHIQTILSIPTTGKNLHNVTEQVQALIKNSGVQVGLCTLFLRHSSASLIVQENADPDVLFDLENFFSRLVPELAAETSKSSSHQ
jgi:secondary thiamine-phosphate synthase enzyme